MSTLSLNPPPVSRAILSTIQSADEIQRLVTAAAEDDHIVVAPTHIVIKNDEIVGYASLGAIRMVNVWVHSKKVNKFESVRLLNEAENILRAGGAGVVCMPCAEHSPFRPYMQRLGYTPLGQAAYCLKNLNPA